MFFIRFPKHENLKNDLKIGLEDIKKAKAKCSRSILTHDDVA